MTPSSLTLADFAEDVQCNRRTFTLVKSGPKAVQWCMWCRSFLKLKDGCPVQAALAQAKP
jgi:hypothetical protein